MSDSSTATYTVHAPTSSHCKVLRSGKQGREDVIVFPYGRHERPRFFLGTWGYNNVECIVKVVAE